MQCKHCNDFSTTESGHCLTCGYTQTESCDACAACRIEALAADDREFDERVALAYI